MDQRNHHEYYIARAEACRQLAERAVSPAIAAIHAELATRYEEVAVQPIWNDEMY